MRSYLVYFNVILDHGETKEANCILNLPQAAFVEVISGKVLLADKIAACAGCKVGVIKGMFKL